MENQLSFIFPIVLIAVFYFLLIRPQKKREKDINTMRSNLMVGDHIITIGGIRGKIMKIKDDVITLETGADKTKMEMMRWAISSVEESSKAKIETKVEDIQAAKKEAEEVADFKEENSHQEENSIDNNDNQEE